MTALASPTVEDVWRRAPDLLRVAHHIPGRLRVKLAEGGLPEGFRLSDLAAAFDKTGAWASALRAASDHPAIRSVKLNALARSCTIQYDPAAVAPAAWEDLLAGRRTPACEDLLRKLLPATLSSVAISN